MYYTVYKTTNQVNGKFYIGTHKTVDLNDDYIGSGKYLKHAIEKHGIENFKKEILFVFDNAEEMFAKEAEIVTVDFLTEENTYNLKVGGFGGFDYINQNPDKFLTEKRLNSLWTNKQRNDRWKAKYATDESFRKKIREASILARKKMAQNNPNGTFFGKSHSDKTKKIIGLKASKYQSGERNSQYGKMWIFNEELKQSVRIEKNTTIPVGWKRGRKIKF